MNFRKERAFTQVALLMSVSAFIAGIIDIGLIFMDEGDLGLRSGFEFSVFILVVSALFYGNVVYHVTRLGQLRRHAVHTSARRETLEAAYGDANPPRTAILIPSYKEEHQVVRQTVLSAALAEHANRRVVLLVDDPPRCSGSELAALNGTRRMIQDLNRVFEEAAGRFLAEYVSYARRLRDGTSAASEEAKRLAGLYEAAAAFVEELGADYASSASLAFAHADRMFMDAIIRTPAAAHRDRAAALRRDRTLSRERIAHEYRRLAALFACELSSFERKTYDNLSHQPNKAMNLNSYIGLLGRSFRKAAGGRGLLRLEECPAEDADLIVPDAEYVLTLDADSVILPDYILKLVREMQADGRLAVAQTPYSAFRGAPTTIERVAGATTDIQYLVHQGFTAFGATFWVGANALLRVSALRDIGTFSQERGYRLPVYIQDKTVIEDTGSTIDLARKDWRLFNYPERLAYSATPPDFGSLLIQRRRWANGGLIIFADLLRLAFRRDGKRPRPVEIWIRAHYLLSPALANCSLLILLVYPFDSNLCSVWLLVSALPYYVLYGRDLKQAGYRRRDVGCVYALTLLLMPVNLAGVGRSVRQIVTGHKSAFGRTPKVAGRTGTPSIHILVILSILGLTLTAVVLNLVWQRYSFAGLWALNAAFMLYGSTTMIGWKEALEDLRGVHPLVFNVARRLRSRRTAMVPAVMGGKTLGNAPRLRSRQIDCVE